MKRIKYIIAAFCTIIAAACTNEDQEAEKTQQEGLTKITASIMSTRATVTNEGKTAWATGDQLSVYTTGGRFKTFTLEGEGGSKTGTFVATLDEGEKVSGYAVYPAGEHYLTDESLTLNMPDLYDYSESDNKTPLVAVLAEGASSAEFSYAGGLLSFEYDNVPPEAKGFMFITENKKITGDFVLSDGLITATDSEGGDTVKIWIAGDNEKEMVFNVPVPVGDYDNYTAALITSDNAIISKSLLSSTDTNSVAAGSLLLMPSVVLLGPNWYVTVEGAGEKNGTSWDDALDAAGFRDLINNNQLSDLDTVYMAAGTYLAGSHMNLTSAEDPNQKTVLTDHIFLRKKVSIYGGFSSNLTGTEHSISYPSQNETIISGDLNGNGTADEGDCHLLHIESNGDTYISGITFSNGYIGSTKLGDQVRPGVYVSGSSTVVNFSYCNFKDNTSLINSGNESGGSALAIWRGTVNFYRCSFLNNKSHDRGGALRVIANNSQKLNIDQCYFEGNSTSGDWGGTIQGNGNTQNICINNSTFYNNTVGNGGGAVYNGASSIYVMNCTMVNNNGTYDFRTENTGQHYYINCIDVQTDGSAQTICVNNNTAISAGHVYYGSKTGGGTWTAGTGDMVGMSTSDIFGSDTPTPVTGAYTTFFKPSSTLTGSTLEELAAFKAAHDVIPSSFDLTVDQNGNKRSSTTTAGSAEL